MVRGAVGIPIAGLLVVWLGLFAGPAVAAPPNDDFANAEQIAGAPPQSTFGTVAQASREPGEPVHGAAAGTGSVWYRWTAGAAGRVTIDTCGASFNTQLAVYTGATVGALTQMAGNEDNGACGNRSGLTFEAVAGETYRVAVDRTGGQDGEFSLRLNPSGDPVNDNFAVARPMEPSNGLDADGSGTTVGATAEPGEIGHQAQPAEQSIWWWWRAPAAGEYAIDTCGSEAATRLGMYVRFSDQLFNVLQAGAGSFCGTGVRSRITVTQAGTTYLLAVDSRDGDTGPVRVGIRAFPKMRLLAPDPVVEGDSGQTDAVFTVALDRPAPQPISVNYATEGFAPTTGFRDWEPAAGTVTFEPGESSKPVVVKVNGDIRDENYTVIFMNLSNPRNVTLVEPRASTVIADDDDPEPPGWRCFDLFCLVAGEGPVRMTRSDDPSELVRTVPITRRGKARTVMEIPSGKLGPVGAGDAIEASGEVEVSVTCLERMRQCVGTRYRYDPEVSARLVLDRGNGSTRLSGTKRLRCSQSLPNRNHHCVLVFPPTARKIAAGCAGCSVQLRLAASSPRAKPGNRLVIGADGDHGIQQDKGHLNAVVREEEAEQPARLANGKHRRGSLPVGGRQSSGRKFVVLSQRIDAPQAYEQYFVDAKAFVRTGQLRYGTFIGAELVLSDSPGSIKQIPNGIITEKNGFNCTRGRSAHDNPCLVRKVGFARVSNPPGGPLYANLVLQAAARFGGRWHSHDRARVLPRGRIEVQRYSPLGWQGFAVPP